LEHNICSGKSSLDSLADAVDFVAEVFDLKPFPSKEQPVESEQAQSGDSINEHIMQFFAYSHLPEHLQNVSKPFYELAFHIVTTLPRNPERTVALRKLLEAKDAAVRARLAK